MKISLDTMDILTILILPIIAHRISFHLSVFLYFPLSVFYSFQCEIFQEQYWVKLYLTFILFHSIVNGIVLLISFLDAHCLVS